MQRCQADPVTIPTQTVCVDRWHILRNLCIFWGLPLPYCLSLGRRQEAGPGPPAPSGICINPKPADSKDITLVGHKHRFLALFQPLVTFLPTCDIFRVCMYRGTKCNIYYVYYCFSGCEGVRKRSAIEHIRDG